MSNKKNKSKKESGFKVLLKGKVDIPLIIITSILVLIGLIILSSASAPTSYSEFGNSYHYLFQQTLYTCVGIFAAVVILNFDYRILKNKAIMIVAYIGVVALMWAVGLIGNAAGGARRWMNIGPISLQPSELAKYGYVVIFAYYLSTIKQKGKIKDIMYGLIGPLVLIVMAVLPIFYKQNHMSTTLIISFVAIIQMFVIGSAIISDMRFVIPVGILGCIAFGVIISSNTQAAISNTNSEASDNFRIARIQTWLNPDDDVTGKGWQINQSLYAVGSGGLFGVGLGESTQKYLYLPEPQNDFIFAVLAEELGFVGSACVIALFVAFIWRGMVIAFRAEDDFSKLIAIGVTSIIGLQALINVAVVTNTIPVTGMLLPFFSYGGTAMIANLCGVGLLLGVSKTGIKNK